MGKPKPLAARTPDTVEIPLTPARPEGLEPPFIRFDAVLSGTWHKADTRSGIPQLILTLPYPGQEFVLYGLRDQGIVKFHVEISAYEQEDIDIDAIVAELEADRG